MGAGSDGASRSGHRRVFPAAKRLIIGERSASEANIGSIGARPISAAYRISGECTGSSCSVDSCSAADGCNTPVGIDHPSRLPIAVTIPT